LQGRLAAIDAALARVRGPPQLATIAEEADEESDGDLDTPLVKALVCIST